MLLTIEYIYKNLKNYRKIKNICTSKLLKNRFFLKNIVEKLFIFYTNMHNQIVRTLLLFYSGHLATKFLPQQSRKW